VKSLWKIVPWLVLALFAVDIFIAMRPKNDGDYHVREFGRLPVLHNGRIQPFDSLARNSLLQLRSTGDLPLEIVPAWKFWHHPKKLKATEWLLELMTRPEVADTRPVFLIHHSDLLSELKLQDKGIEHSGLRYYAFNDLKSVGAEILEQGRKASDAKEEERTTFQKQVLKLANAVNIYNRLKFTLQPEGEDNWSQQLADFQRDLGPARAAAHASRDSKEFDREAIERIARPVKLFEEMATYGYALTVPPLDRDASPDHWQNAGTVLLDGARSDELHPAVRYFAAMATAYRDNHPADFNRTVAEYHSWLESNKFGKELGKGRAEFYYNDVKAFLHASIIYLCAFVMAGICLLTLNVLPTLSETFRRAAFYLILLAGAVHTFGLVFRMVLEGRPPVTNLYSSAIFIGWGAMVLGVLIERVYRIGLGIVVASLAGFVTLLIAHNLALGGDTMEMMRAVLDTNFWLATHVVVVTLGYASTFFAGLLAMVYIFLGLFTPLLTQKLNGPAGSKPTVGPLEIGKALAKMVYGIICFATLFSFVGTVLGGIWADQSWGRFWGWDPKENGALLIVIWNALILHARWGGLVRERGLITLAVFGNIVTSFSWFGVNMLGIGLHSYGFMDAAFTWLMMFIVIQLLLIGDALLPLSWWRSFRGPNRGSGALKWVAVGFNVWVMLTGLFVGFNSAWCIAALLCFFAFVVAVYFASRSSKPRTPPAPGLSGALRPPVPSKG
jgi:cytochrome c-type biogenesis protein CcsB